MRSTAQASEAHEGWNARRENLETSVQRACGLHSARHGAQNPKTKRAGTLCSRLLRCTAHGSIYDRNQSWHILRPTLWHPRPQPRSHSSHQDLRSNHESSVASVLHELPKRNPQLFESVRQQGEAQPDTHHASQRLPDPSKAKRPRSRPSRDPHSRRGLSWRRNVPLEECHQRPSRLHPRLSNGASARPSLSRGSIVGISG